jgi:hypothetical protein
VSAAGPSQDVHASRAKPRREARGCERGREADAKVKRVTEHSKEAEANCSPSGGSAAATAASVGDHI